MGDVTRQQQRGHVLPRDVFKTLVRLEAKVDWHVSEVDVADQLHLPHSYVDPVVTLASQVPVAFSFPRGHRTDLVSYSTPVGVSAATYDAQSTWTEEVEPPRVVVGFQSSVVRERRRQVYPQSNGDSNAHSGLDSDGQETSLQGVPGNTFDPFQWLRNQPDGLDKVKALNARLVELTTSDAPNQSCNVDAPPTTTAADLSDKGAADDCVVKPMAITVVLPAGLALTYRVPPTRSVASLKHAIAKKLTTKRSRETKDVRDDIVVPGMLTLYLKGLKLVDTNDLGGSGVQDRSSLVVRKKKKIQHTNVMLFELRLQELAAARGASDLAVLWDNQVELLNEAALDALVRTLCLRESNMMALNPNLSIPRKHGHGRFCLQECHAPRGNWRYVARYHQKAVNVIQTPYLRSMDITRIGQDKAPADVIHIEAILRQSTLQVVDHLCHQRHVIVDDMTVEWTFATPQGGRREVPFLIGAQRIRGTDGVVDTAKSEPFTRLKRELEDLRLPAKSDTSDVAVHPRQVKPNRPTATDMYHVKLQVVCRHCREPREVELSKELAKTHTLLRQALTNREGSQAKSTIQSLQLQLDAQMTQVQDSQEGIAQAQVATSEMAAALAEVLHARRLRDFVFHRLADMTQPGVNPPKRCAGGFGSYPVPTSANVAEVVGACWLSCLWLIVGVYR
ncbi:hypothetical protein DYB36_001455 [Aphanomyces astaci]|uniref:Ubiquitin-like domain-containing protein n=1 Tax=Aphanomyces astaci TaxID=112090 RepID=A0A396ZW19_APHAT|nr:hypothetical protein DYB36_001455 [Aphanomyces astaci]